MAVGTTVSFPNFDPFFHNVFSYSKPKKFDLGRYAQGKSAEVKFDKPGIVNLFCEIHYSMKAYIHVLATPYFAAEYTIDHLNLDPSLKSNIKTAYYEAGHMMYIDVKSLAKLKQDVAAFIQSSLPRQ